MIYVAYVLYIRDIRNIRNIKNFYCWWGMDGVGWGKGGVVGGGSGGCGRVMDVIEWMLLTGVENFLCEKMFFGSFF